MIIEAKMTDEAEEINVMALDKEMEDTVHAVILACGVRPLKEKVNILILTIDYIYAHNKQLEPVFSDKITLH